MFLSSLALIASVAGSSASADELTGSRSADAVALQAAEPEDDDSWQWRLAPYLFAAGFHGDLTAGNLEFEADRSFSDIVDNLDFGAMLFFEGHHDQWGFALDGMYIDLEENGTTQTGASAKASLQLGLAEALGLYRVAPKSPVEIAFGLRYVDVEQDLEAGIVDRGGSVQAVDAIVGGRGNWTFAKHWSFTLYGDVGTGDSDLTWQALGNVAYHFERHWGLGLGYRALGYNVDDGSNELDITLAGWVLGFEYRF